MPLPHGWAGCLQSGPARRMSWEQSVAGLRAAGNLDDVQTCLRQLCTVVRKAAASVASRCQRCRCSRLVLLALGSSAELLKER